jgi:hypothetical protein
VKRCAALLKDASPLTGYRTDSPEVAERVIQGFEFKVISLGNGNWEQTLFGVQKYSNPSLARSWSPHSCKYGSVYTAGSGIDTGARRGCSASYQRELQLQPDASLG